MQQTQCEIRAYPSLVSAIIVWKENPTWYAVACNAAADDSLLVRYVCVRAEC